MKACYRVLLLCHFLIPAIGKANFADSTFIKAHLTELTKNCTPRKYNNLTQLNKAALYIQSVFNQYSDSVSIQEYTVNHLKYRNVICSFGNGNSKRIVVGAHYDVCGNQQGADDNASGVVGLLELARMLKGQKLNFQIDLVAYTLEEPPHFGTENMGSYVHAKSIYDAQANLYGMISLEMIGYFKTEPNSQKYPSEHMARIYGDTGDFIALVKKVGAGKFSTDFCKKYLLSNTIKAVEIALPETLSGVSYSDHLNYWKFHFDALMITDTSFFRNPNYHQSTDTMDTLDIGRMAKTIDGVLAALVSL